MDERYGELELAVTLAEAEAHSPAEGSPSPDKRPRAVAQLASFFTDGVKGLP